MGGETGDIGSSVVIVISIVLAVILMFIFPMLVLSGRADDIAQVTVQSATAEYVITICSTGRITPEASSQFEQTIYSTGNSYEIGYQIGKGDGNSEKKTTTISAVKAGEQEYYYEFTNEVTSVLNSGEDYVLNKDDQVTVTVKNNNQTIFQTLASVFYQTPSDSAQIVASSTGVVGASGD